ncbi:MAG: molybdopterin oxidoreductase iron-sulfur binding subunit [Puniceicoccaceae bacterium 5H]|nr:MAG: molybdopterin oxidoreductase iron-sulfur binding subunit [Puniceicoccaceae bacterium 5H]
MIQDFQQSSAPGGQTTGKSYWRSLDELADTQAFRNWLHREFPQGASEATGVNRRHFLKIMAASFGAAGIGLAGCRRPEQNILPYSRQPENSIPGVPVFYTTSFPDAVDSLPLVVETHQHRPTHIEGNPGYKSYGGSTNVFAQASILNLYDPDRMTASSEGNNRRISSAEAADILGKVANKFGQTNGQGLAILAEPSSSPTRARLVQQLKQQMPRLRWAEYAPSARTSPDKALTQALGRPARPVYHLDQAKVILGVDSDFTLHEPGSLALARGFAAGRRAKNQADAKNMNRLYMAESAFTATGAMSDHRLRVPTSQIPAFVAQLAAEILSQSGGDSGLASQLREQAASANLDEAWVRECAADLLANRGHAVLHAGSHLPLATQQLVQAINAELGAVGHTVDYVELPQAEADSIEDLAQAIEAGEVETLLILGGNPVYNAPANLEWDRLQKKVGQVIRHGFYYDETSLLSQVNIASTHYLESWSDGFTYEGALVPVQPMVLPIFEGVSELEVVARLGGRQTSDVYALVVETFGSYTNEANKDKAFQRFLSDGGLFEHRFQSINGRVEFGSLRNALSQGSFQAPSIGSNALEVRLKMDDTVGDGYWNNNGWLQELPDPLTKLTWDNAILVSPKLAEELGYDTGKGTFLIGGISKKQNNFVRDTEVSPVAEVTVDGVTVRGPVHILPGLPDYSVTVSLGYGRSKVGRVGKNTGFNAYPLTHSKNFFARNGAKIKLVGEHYPLSNTSQHWSMEGRAIIREANVEHHLEHPDWVNHMGMESHSPPVYGNAKDMPLQEKSLKQPRGNSLYEHPDFGSPPPNVDAWKKEGAMDKFVPEQQWGMSIDLNTCVGCNACIIACQSENNIPIVGKEQVAMGREMHWIRLDRYFSSGDLKQNQVSLPANPQASFMPLGCVHCENAPCEQVCPVNATVHDRQGLNVMAYNRCVGTRYCANNCPYKVRRFNFFDYNKRNVDELYAGPLGTNKYKTEGGTLVSMQRNPDVTVRMRGVMEKCTFCVQRIEQAKIAQRVKAADSNDIRIPDGLVRVACQNACPTDAIVFGDISDADTAVSESKANDRDYALLGYLNVRPRTTYLARLRNPNPKMPDFAEPFSYQEYFGKGGTEHQPAKGGSHGETEHGAETNAGHGESHESSEGNEHH